MYQILLCDDEKDIVTALEIYLRNDDYKIFKAYNGADALKILTEEEIHLVLLDIMMPHMDGIAALTKLREFSNVPVILLTAKSEDIDKVLRHVLNHSFAAICSLAAAKRKAMFILLAVSY